VDPYIADIVRSAAARPEIQKLKSKPACRAGEAIAHIQDILATEILNDKDAGALGRIIGALGSCAAVPSDVSVGRNHQRPEGYEIMMEIATYSFARLIYQELCSPSITVDTPSAAAATSETNAAVSLHI
jgi:hypothetical protein